MVVPDVDGTGGAPPQTLRGSLAAFPIDMLLALLADAKATGRLELGAAASVTSLEITTGRATAAAHGALRGEEALTPIFALESGSFAFSECDTGQPNLSTGSSDRLRDRARAARVARESRPRPPGPNTLRFAALRRVLPPLVPDGATVASLSVPTADLVLGVGAPEERPAPTPDPLWSARHLAAILNAMLFGYLGVDEAVRTRELGTLAAVGRMQVPGVEGALPLVKGGLDVEAVDRAGRTATWVVPLLHVMIRRLFEDDDAVQEGSHAQRVYLAAIARTLGSSDGRLVAEALRLVGTGSPLRARITVERGGAEGPFDLGEREHGIGRSSANDVRLENSSVSRRHARLSPRSGRFVLVDVGSTAGTRVNGEAVTGERVLRSGDSIAVGDVLLTFEHLEA